MSLITDLKTYIGSYAGLTALISNRLYPMMLPQEPTLPAATYLIADDPQNYSHSGASWRQARVQFDCFASTYLAAHGVADQVEAAVNAWHQINSSYTSFQLTCRDMEESPELSRYRVMVEVSVDH